MIINEKSFFKDPFHFYENQFNFYYLIRRTPKQQHTTPTTTLTKKRKNTSTTTESNQPKRRLLRKQNNIIQMLNPLIQVQINKFAAGIIFHEHCSK